jgi:RAB protein geranylgeranyltransferase component A
MFHAGQLILTECSVLSVQGKKVLHIDRNDHYGGYVMQGLLTSRADMLTL